jgi:alginate O-acetyltransferase complex protein AlgI
VNYVIFFPAITAGPIDRVERFVAGLNSPLPLDAEGWVDAGQRIFTGLFKKFVVADALAWIALNEAFARDAQSTGWLWTLLYAYSLRIYLISAGIPISQLGLAGCSVFGYPKISRSHTSNQTLPNSGIHGTSP